MRLIVAGICLALGLATATSATSAEPGGVRSAQYKRCMDLAGGVDPTLRECSGAELAREDASLNAAYRDLQAQVRRDQSAEYVKGRLDGLRNAQRAWIAHRDADCEAEAYEALGGTLWYILLNECHIDATQARTRVLRGWLARERELR